MATIANEVIVITDKMIARETVDSVLDGVIAFMGENGYSVGTSKHYKAAQISIKRFYSLMGETAYSNKVTDCYVEYMRQRHKDGALSHETYIRYKRFAAIANEYFKNKKLLTDRLVTENLRQVNADHQILLDEFKNKVLILRYNSKVTNGKISSVRTFLFYVEDKVDGGLKALTRNRISDFLTETARRRRPSMRMLIDDVKQFVKFLILCEIVSENLIGAFDVYAPKDKKIYPGFTEEESTRMLAAVDRNTAMGKRDYAMLVLAKHTGIREVDIRNLKLHDIFWGNSEIRIIQRKTRKPLVLPLEIPVGNAIADYILNARPVSSDCRVFLRVVPPFVGLTYAADIVQKYAKISGVEKETNAQIGFHGFRRAMGISLLEADVPLALISEILGHAKRNSLKRYIALDVERLRGCSMPMNELRCRKEELC